MMPLWGFVLWRWPVRNWAKEGVRFGDGPATSCRKVACELCIHLLKASGFLGGTSLIIVKTKDNCIWISLMTAVFCLPTLCSSVQHPSPTAFSPVWDRACTCGPFCATIQWGLPSRTELLAVGRYSVIIWCPFPLVASSMLWEKLLSLTCLWFFVFWPACGSLCFDLPVKSLCFDMPVGSWSSWRWWGPAFF